MEIITGIRFDLQSFNRRRTRHQCPWKRQKSGSRGLAWRRVADWDGQKTGDTHSPKCAGMCQGVFKEISRITEKNEQGCRLTVLDAGILRNFMAAYKFPNIFPALSQSGNMSLSKM